MSHSDPSAWWACLSLDLAELLQVTTRLRDIVRRHEEQTLSGNAQDFKASRLAR